MTTKPRARRFRLRLSEDATGAPLSAASATVAGQGGALRGERGQAGSAASGNVTEDAARQMAERRRAEGQAAEGQGVARADTGEAARAGAPVAESGASPAVKISPEAAELSTKNPLTAAARSAAAAMAMAKLRQGVAGQQPAPASDAGKIEGPASSTPAPAAPVTPARTTGVATTPRPPRDSTRDHPEYNAVQPPETPAERPATRTDEEAEAEAEIEAIRAEELTGRQLRMAMRVAQKHGVKATSGLEAVRLLRRQGVDPFEHSTLIDIVQNRAVPGRALATVDAPALPKTIRQPGMPAMPGIPAPAERSAEIARIQQDIVRRRRRRLALLGARLSVFVFLPTFLAAWYFFVIATPLYATNTEFVIQQADAQSSGGAGGALGGLFSGTGMATSQDSVTVQSYLQSREAMRRLDADHGFKAHFQSESMDPIRRLAMDTTDEAAYRLYRRMVQISYDPTEGIIKMEVIAATPETSERFSRALIQYAEEQVDQLTQRLRANQMSDALDSFERAEAQMLETQMRVLELQESYQVLSSEVEVTLLTQQITTLEGQINQERLSLADLLANPRPNAARVQQVERRIGALDTQIQALRSSLTRGEAGGASLARVQREMVMAEADVATRQLMLATSLQQLEAARIEANRQVRYLSMGVSPVAPDESTYPRRFENTALAFLIFAGLYLMISMTVSILREQVTS